MANTRPGYKCDSCGKYLADCKCPDLNVDQLALIFRAGQPDQYGRISSLQVSGTDPNGYSRVVVRNVMPHVHDVRRAMSTIAHWRGSALSVEAF